VTIVIFRQGNGSFVAACDSCRFGWWTKDEKVPTFTGSRHDVIQSLAEDHGWRIKRRLLRRLPLMLCAACAPLHDCPGHVWEPQTYTGATSSFLVCDRCGHVADYLDTPPAGHPESMTAVLPDVDEEWLAALDAELDPDHANEEV
jgi:hypothetical protein